MGCGFQIRISIHFNDSSGIITAEVQHEGASVGLTRCRQIADSQSVVQAEHGAAGAHRSVFSRIIEFVAGTQIEHGLVVSREADRREGANEVNIVRVGMAAANGAYSNAAERGGHDVAARRGVVAVVGRVGLGLVPLHEVRRASSEGCQAVGGKVERSATRSHCCSLTIRESSLWRLRGESPRARGQRAGRACSTSRLYRACAL